MSQEVRYLSLCGLLGYGYPAESLRRGLAARPDFVGVDAGSTDPGPYYLGSGKGFAGPGQVRADLEPALIEAVRGGLPLVVGTAGGSGAASHVDAFLEILHSICGQNDLHFRLATIRSDVSADLVLDALDRGLIAPCGPSGELTAPRVQACGRIVAQMGTGPIIQALEAGADVVVAGRCCDTAVFAALPILRGLDPALSLHCAKIAECGTLCARPGGANDSLLCSVREDHFIVEPVNPQKRCFIDSVAAHSLYEQPDPLCFYEPEGKVDLSGCMFEPHGVRGVKVSGTRLEAPTVPTIKLEGAALRGYRAISIAGVRDPRVIAQIDEIEQQVRQSVEASVVGRQGHSLRLLKYGLDAVTGPREIRPNDAPREIGIVIEAVAPTQELADEIVALARSTALHQHFEGRKTTAGNLAFPFSPSDLQGGPVYEFSVYHLMQAPEPEALFSLTLEEF